MITKHQLYEDFQGYNAYQIQDADRIIRERIVKLLDTMLYKIIHCSDKARNDGREKLLSIVDTIRRRTERIKEEVENKSLSYISPELKMNITHVDEKKLKNIDFKLENLLAQCNEITEMITCKETELYIIGHFTSINSVLREFEEQFRERTIALKKEVR